MALAVEGAVTTTSFHCLAVACVVRVLADHAFCRAHWKAVPREMQDAITGRNDIDAVMRARAYVARREGHIDAADRLDDAVATREAKHV